MAFFRTYISKSLGALPLYQMFSDVNMTRREAQSVGGGFPGETCPLWGGLFQLVQNRSGGDITIGQNVSLYFGAAARIGNLVVASTPAVLTTDDTLDSDLAGSDMWPGWVGVTAGVFATTAAETRRRIETNSTAAGASTITVAGGPLYTGFTDGIVQGDPRLDPDAIGTIAAPPDATYDYETFCPWEVVLSDADSILTSTVQGTCCSTTITNGKLGVIQIQGIAMANVDGTTDLVAGDRLIADSASGVLSKYVAGTSDPALVYARILGAYTNNGVGLRMVQLMNRPLFPYPIPV